MKILYTSNLYKESVTVSWIKTNNQIKCYYVWSFFERNICFVSIIGGGKESEEKRCFLQITVRFICQETAEQYKPFPPPPPLSLHLSFPLAVKVPQYSTSTDHLVAFLHDHWLDERKLIIEILTLRWNPTFNTLKLQNCIFLLNILLCLKDIYNTTHGLGVTNSRQ